MPVIVMTGEDTFKYMEDGRDPQGGSQNYTYYRSVDEAPPEIQRAAQDPRPIDALVRGTQAPAPVQQAAQAVGATVGGGTSTPVVRATGETQAPAARQGVVAASAAPRTTAVPVYQRQGMQIGTTDPQPLVRATGETRPLARYNPVTGEVTMGKPATYQGPGAMAALAAEAKSPGAPVQVPAGGGTQPAKVIRQPQGIVQRMGTPVPQTTYLPSMSNSPVSQPQKFYPPVSSQPTVRVPGEGYRIPQAQDFQQAPPGQVGVAAEQTSGYSFPQRTIQGPTVRSIYDNPSVAQRADLTKGGIQGRPQQGPGYSPFNPGTTSTAAVAPIEIDSRSPGAEMTKGELQDIWRRQLAEPLPAPTSVYDQGYVTPVQNPFVQQRQPETAPSSWSDAYTMEATPDRSNIRGGAAPRDEGWWQQPNIINITIPPASGTQVPRAAQVIPRIVPERQYQIPQLQDFPNYQWRRSY